jgi:phosphoglycerol transferase MdoB-like AlkP superfamily enzyme
MIQRVRNRIAAFTVFFAALALHRFQILGHLELGLEGGLEAGLGWGLLEDLNVAIGTLLLSGLCTAVTGRWRLSWIAWTFLTFTSSVANAIYLRFFDDVLNWWVVMSHWSDLSVVQGSASSLGNTIPIGASIVLLILSFAMTPPDPPRAGRRQALVPLAIGCLLILACGVAPKKFIKTHEWRAATVLTDSAPRRWIRQNISTSYKNLSNAAVLERIDDIDLEAARRTLVSYRNRGLASEQTATPLLAPLGGDPATSKALRRRLGLPEEGPINVIVLFLESVRTFEMLDAEIAPQIFPGTLEMLEKYGLWFTQAYSSSLSAGQTVRGQFSTQCGMLPNIGGAATYIAHGNLRIHCLQRVLVDHGYETVWLNTHTSDYHGKRHFEARQGIRHFYDRSHFSNVGVESKVGAWGLADGPFLVESKRILEGTRHPFYANLLTISTHHPFGVIDEGPIPQPLAKAYADREDYLGYLSRLRYLDLHLPVFIRGVLEGPLGDNTVIVLLGDHGTSVLPRPLSTARKTELAFRIPLALLTRDMPTPGKIARQVHQIDVPHTVARLVGANAEVTWVGRGLFEEEGSPWVYLSDAGISFREGDRACYAGLKGAECFGLQGVDPLFAADLAPYPGDPAPDLAFYKKVIEGNLSLIAFNGFLPINAGPSSD